MTELWQLGVHGLADAYAQGSADPIAVTEACLERISAVDDTVRAFCWVDAEGALKAARRCSRELASSGPRGPLHGVPIAIKELFDVAGLPAEYGSLTRVAFVAKSDAEVVTRLRRAGAIIMGTTRSHEFGWGITTQHAARGSTRNPWAIDRVPGGSSGGSAAAVAAGMVPAAIASDTGGSIRIPSAFCGVAGIKPTFGRIPRTGGVALAPSLDTVGIIARQVGDLWPVLAFVAGPEHGDPASVANRLRALSPPDETTTLAGMRIGHSPALFEFAVQTPRSAMWHDALARAAALGAELVALDLPPAAEFRSTFATVQMAEAYDVHAHQLGIFPQRSDDYGPDVRARIVAAGDVSLADYLAASRFRLALVAALTSALSTVDVLLSPISTVPPPLVTDPDTAVVDGDRYPLREAVMGFTVPQNLSGLPCVAINAGFAPDNLPFGLQITAGRGHEDLGLTAARLLEAELGMHNRPGNYPPMPVTR